MDIYHNEMSPKYNGIRKVKEDNSNSFKFV